METAVETVIPTIGLLPNYMAVTVRYRYLSQKYFTTNMWEFNGNVCGNFVGEGRLLDVVVLWFLCN